MSADSYIGTLSLNTLLDSKKSALQEGVVEQLSWDLAAIKKNAASTRGNIVLLTLGAGTPYCT